MASQIVYDSIDVTFPVAGKDNDSQGFRDNFTVIHDNFQYAKGEIEALQLNNAVKNGPNDFGNNNILRARFVNCSDVVYAAGEVNQTTVIDYAVGPVQSYRVTGSMQFSIGNFPTSGSYGKITLELTGNDPVSPYSVVFGLVGSGQIKKGPNARALGSINVSSSSQPMFFEFWTSNGGQVVYMEYLGTFE